MSDFSSLRMNILIFSTNEREKKDEWEERKAIMSPRNSKIGALIDVVVRVIYIICYSQISKIPQQNEICFGLQWPILDLYPIAEEVDSGNYN